MPVLNVTLPFQSSQSMRYGQPKNVWKTSPCNNVNKHPLTWINLQTTTSTHIGEDLGLWIISMWKRVVPGQNQSLDQQKARLRVITLKLKMRKQVILCDDCNANQTTSFTSQYICVQLWLRTMLLSNLEILFPLSRFRVFLFQTNSAISNTASLSSSNLNVTGMFVQRLYMQHFLKDNLEKNQLVSKHLSMQ